MANYLESISTITGKPEPTFEEKNKVMGWLKKDLTSPPRRMEIWPFSSNPSEWINKKDPNYQPSIFAEPTTVDFTGSGIMKEVGAMESFVKKIPGKSGLPSIESELRTAFGGKKKLTAKNVSVNDFLKMGHAPEEARELVNHVKGLKRGKVFWTNLSPEGDAYMRQQASLTSTGQTPIHVNSKTGMSIDFSTECAKRRGGIGACPY